MLSRRFSALINGNDEGGLLWGNWSGDYKDGTAPSHWSSSTDIFREYAQTGKPVKWGQCFAFAGCMTTCMRCLGIPCRPGPLRFYPQMLIGCCEVTNYWSAHDVHSNRAIDKFFEQDGSRTSKEDSIWTYHVWNEVSLRLIERCE